MAPLQGVAGGSIHRRHTRPQRGRAAESFNATGADGAAPSSAGDALILAGGSTTRHAVQSDGNHGIERTLVDFDVLARWMDQQGLPAGAIEQVELLAGGTQNVLCASRAAVATTCCAAGRSICGPHSNDVMRREPRVL